MMHKYSFHSLLYKKSMELSGVLGHKMCRKCILLIEVFNILIFQTYVEFLTKVFIYI